MKEEIRNGWTLPKLSIGGSPEWQPLDRGTRPVRYRAETNVVAQYKSF